MNKKSIRHRLIAFIALLGALLFAAYLQVRKWLYPPSPAVLPQPADSPFRKVSFHSEDRLNICGWYAPPASGQALLMLHGHSGNRDQLLVHADYLLAAGYGLLLIDFRNHGDSDGRMTSMGCHEIKDARAAYRFLQAQDAVQQIVIWGHSMGGAVASQLMRESGAAGLFIDATFADFPSIVRAGVRRRGLPQPIARLLTALYGILSDSDWRACRPIDYLAAVEVPVLLFHGAKDTLIPLTEAQRLVRANPRIRLKIFADGTHSDLYELEPQRYRREVLAYLNEVFD